MGRAKNLEKKCLIEGCKKFKILRFDGRIDSSFCSTHKDRATINAFLGRLYCNMNNRVQGKASHNRGNWKGKSILPRDVFFSWAKNHSDFLSLYKRYVMNNFNRGLAPSINRIDSDRGYTLDNMEWMTNSQNSGLAGTVKKMNAIQKKIVYDVLGVKR